MQAPVNTTSLGQFLVQIRTRDTKKPDSAVLGNALGRILYVLLSYLDDKTLKRLMKVSRRVLWQVVESNIPIPLSLCVNSDFDNKLRLAKDKLDALKRETGLCFSLEVDICSNCVTWADDLKVLLGLESYIERKDDAQVVRSIAIKNLHVDLKEINKHMARSISFKGLRTLDLSGYHCKDKDIFEVHFASELTLNTLEEVKVNLCSVRVLRILCETNKGLRVLKLDAKAGNGDRTSIFSTLSALPVVTLKKISVRSLRVVTGEESEELQKFVKEQRQLSKLSLSLCQVSTEACDNFVRMLKQAQFGTLKLRRLHMGQREFRCVVEQIGNMTQLKSLTVTHNHCIETDAERLCSGLGNLTSLRQLNLSSLTLSAHGVSELAGALTNLQRLEQLDLSDNRFHDIDVSPFVDALTAFSKLTRLRVCNCGMTDGVSRQMETVLQKQI